MVPTLNNIFRPKPKLITPEFKVHVSLCVHRTIDADALTSIIGLLHCQNPKIVMTKRSGEALIDRARSCEASAFLNTDAEILFFVDDDVVFNPVHAAEFLKKMYFGNYDILCGAYLSKVENNPFAMVKIFPDQKLSFHKDAEPVEVRYGCTGFMAIRREVLETMKQHPEVHLCYPQKFWSFFRPIDREVDGQMRELGEDWAFCHKARDMGFKVWLDPSIRLAHAGRYVYTLDDLSRPQRVEHGVINYSEEVEAFT